MFECFHCLMRTVIWDSDFSGEDIGIDDGDAIVHYLHCSNCGAQIEYIVPSTEFLAESEGQAVGVTEVST